MAARGSGKDSESRGASVWEGYGRIAGVMARGYGKDNGSGGTGVWEG